MIASGATRVTDAHFTAAARAVAGLAGDKLLPSLTDVRKVSAAVAKAVGAADPVREMWEPSYLRYRRMARS
jgi:malic enzyme